MVEFLEAKRLQRTIVPWWIGGGSAESQIRISSDILFSSPIVEVSHLEVVSLNENWHYHDLAFSLLR